MASRFKDSEVFDRKDNKSSLELHSSSSLLSSTEDEPHDSADTVQLSISSSILTLSTAHVLFSNLLSFVIVINFTGFGILLFFGITELIVLQCSFSP